MTMKDFYKLTISQAIDLKYEAAENGTIAGTKWNKNTYRNNILVKYKDDIYQIDSVLGIVDINDTAKEIEL